MAQPTLFTLVSDFFTKHLGAEQNVSPHTIAAYRDAIKLLIHFAMKCRGISLDSIRIDDLTPEVVLSFLDHLEGGRRNSIRTRNHRLAAVKSFFRYVLYRIPEHAALAERVRAIPSKRGPRPALGYLSEEEVEAILSQVDRTTPAGRRDYLLLALLYDTGSRIQEILDVCPRNFRLESPSLVRLMGKGRKERICPLLPQAAQLVKRYLLEEGRSEDDPEPLFRNRAGEKLGRHGARYILRKYLERAAHGVPNLLRRRVSPHTFRHTKAMHLLESGTPLVTIKDLIGHADVRSTQIYVTSDVEAKRRAIEAAGSPTTVGRKRARLKPDLLAWLESL